MSKLGEKLHSILYRLRGGIDVAKTDVDEMVKELTTHIGETVIPEMEAKLNEVLPALVKTAVSDALQLEREAAREMTKDLKNLMGQYVPALTNFVNQSVPAPEPVPVPEVAEPAAEAPAPAETPAA